jgi:hypothetical protein
MLKRNDLAKQFELLSLQEIKNYSDSLNGVLQSIRDIKAEMHEIRQESLENHALLHSIQSGIRIEITSAQEKIITFQKKLDAYYDEHKLFSQLAMKEFEDLDDRLEKKVTLDGYYHQRLDDLTFSISDLKQSLFEVNARLTDSSNELLSRFQAELKCTKEDSVKMPDHLDSLQAAFEDKISSHRIDVAGIKEELSIAAFSAMIADKKIEDLYMQIERLKKAGESK